MKRGMNILIIAYVLVVFLVLAYFYNNWRKGQDEVNQLVKLKINGRITALKDLHRGSYFIEINTKNGIIKKYSLPIASYIERYNIQIGDSVSKVENDRKLFFYKGIKNKEVLNYVYYL